VGELFDILSDSQQELLLLIKRTSSLTVAEATDQLDLAETTIRQHMSQLENKGLVERSKQVEGRGRPQLKYSLTDKAQDLFPSQSGPVLYRLMEFLTREGYHAEVDRFIREYWEERRERLDSLLEETGEDFESRLEVIESFLRDEGFLPEIDKMDDGSVRIRECNCPLSQIVESTRLPCRLEAEFLEDVVGQALERVEYMPDGSPACTYQFEADESQE
jgi:predicted ArsR family transcriptional regulator